MTFENSLDNYNRAASIAGRSLTRSKAPGRLFDVGKGPLYALYGEGCRIVDVDQQEYIDMICGLGAISIGYGSFAKAVREEVEDGWVYSLPSYYEPLAAESILTHVAPWASSIRFVKTGSEATAGALLVAQRATGRKAYLRLRGSYHGWHGVWQDDADHVRWFDVGEYPSSDAFEDVAAVFIEPPRWQPFAESWIREVCKAARDGGALVVFDEMIWGGRFRLGGLTEFFGIAPDMAAFGKAIGNGAPIACVVGNAALAEHGELISGTYSGDAASLAAVVSTIKAYTDSNLRVIERLWERGRQLRDGLNIVAASAPSSCAFEVEGQPVHQRIRFANDDDGAIGRAFAAGMAARGVLWHPQVVNVCFAHNADDITAVIDAANAVVETLR